MITHVVLLEPQGSWSVEQQRAILDAIDAAVRGCPTVRACRIGRRVLHGLAGYEQAMRDEYQFALMLDFDDVEGLRTYLTHPQHAVVGGFFTSAAARSLAYDYQMMDVEHARAALPL
jgi:hypothetical protein